MTEFLIWSVLLAADAGPKLRIDPGAKSVEVKVTATLPEAVRAQIPEGKLSQDAGERFLRLAILSSADGAEGPAILGAYERRGEQLSFVPRFALVPGGRYRATLLVEGKAVLHAEHRVPERAATTPAIVEAVYPTSTELPANLLKFYLHFSKPMREERGIFDRIQILDEERKPVEDPWRRTELWNDDATRLTLWIHPGRTKKGVNLGEEIGPVLEPNRRYTLVVGAELRDADGQALGKPFTREFRTTDPVQTAIDVRDWKIDAPAAKSRGPLRVSFPRPLDRALLSRCLSVKSADGKTVSGRIKLGANETSWSFEPEEPWRQGEYSLEVDETLEDLAGNTLLGPFDLDRRLPAVKKPQRAVAFRVKE